MERTTIMADPLLLLRARRFAKRDKRTLSSVVNEALERFLGDKEPREKKGFPYEPVGASGGRFGHLSRRVDETLEEILEEEDRERRERAR
jgi:hypothetical protein